MDRFERTSGDAEVDRKVERYGLAEEKFRFKGDYRQREGELLTRLKGKKTPFGQDRVGVLTEEELRWDKKDMMWRKMIKIKLDTPKRRGSGSRPPCSPSDMEFQVCGEGTTEEKALDKAWSAIVNAFHARVNPKAPVPIYPADPFMEQF